jgi:hypothetical protein
MAVRAETLPVLTSPDRAVRFIEDAGDVLATLNDLATCGMIERELTHRVERDLLGVINTINSCFSETRH